MHAPQQPDRFDPKEDAPNRPGFHGVAVGISLNDAVREHGRGGGPHRLLRLPDRVSARGPVRRSELQRGCGLRWRLRDRASGLQHLAELLRRATRAVGAFVRRRGSVSVGVGSDDS